MDLLDPDAVATPAFVLEAAYPAGEGAWHVHRRAQLVHADEGVVTVETREASFVAPPERAVWIPPGHTHRVRARRAYRLTTLYVEPSRSPSAEARVVSVDPLARELLRAAAKLGHAFADVGPEARLVAVLLDRLPTLDVLPSLRLERPRDEALAKVVAALEADPADTRTLAEHAASVALGEKTFARRFVAETGQSFGRWRQRHRLIAALERLGEGQSVTEVAFAVGYADVSSFIATFKATFGETPARYFALRQPTA
ncbi:MAG: helix-turn-helix transcriptional regulator [Sandaracinus sp.]|nr:helix-turn-helix transcriptional regulator [Myxococcales bacterium]MCB9633246.1 helix-turn-helix transcriptional regulator [Sandaracinus sp.]